MTRAGSVTAGLPMYDLPEVRSYTDSLYEAIAAELRTRGVDAPESLQRDLPSLRDHWLDPQLLLSHTCGYPAVDALDAKVEVLGSWATVTDDEGSPGWYRTLIVVRDDDMRADDLKSFIRGGLRLCANGPESLSGWISLSCFLHAEHVTDELLSNEVSVLVTGGHAATLAAIAANEADLASVDPWTFHQLARWRPAATAGLRVIGRGPTVAVTPLITRLDGPVTVLRESLAAVALNPEHLETLTALGIAGFVPHGLEAHNPVREMVERCEPTIGLLRRIFPTV
jgi:ABC-type phosphate/phosphonate transport system substrate-binding protein